MVTRVCILLSLVVLIGAPFVLRPDAASVPAGARTLIIVSPHTETIRAEFGRAFDVWHRAAYGEPVNVIWEVPGGTSEIVRMLQAQYAAAVRNGQTPGGSKDLMFGGGSYVFDQLSREMSVEVDGVAHSVRVLAPVPFRDDELDAIYGARDIAGIPLHDPAGFWFGTALSSFGIIFNRDVLATIDVAPPGTWADLCDPRYRGWIASVNPGQSGSVTTAFQAIIDRLGWVDGWRILRRIGANSRYFSAVSNRPPHDVGQGDAAAGICIDFYGRYEAQSIRTHGGGDRLGYVDPPGVTTIDPDPIAMLTNAPHPEVARRFIEFCLSDEGQALWQFRLDDPDPDGLGPERFELRRLPIRRDFYDRYLDRFVDRVNPYDFARRLEHANPDVRSFIPILFAAMVIDSQRELQAAWEAIVAHPAYPVGRGVVTAADVDDPGLKAMLERFDAMPEAPDADGVLRGLSDDASLGAIKQGWRTPALWDPEARPRDVARVDFARFFRRKYAEIVELADGG